jgi:hydrogenase/urease accessory protein HupE
MTLAIAGLLAGFIHVLSGPDHLAAIAPYAVDGKGRAWRTGVRWGFGHATGALAVGLLVLAMREALPIEAVSAWGERLVGLALIGIGIWGIGVAWSRSMRRLHPRKPHAHGHAAFGLGTLHGVAGSSHLLGMLPALAMPSDFAAGLYLLLFGIGSVAAMGTFSSLVGWIAGRPGVSGPRAQGTLQALASLIAVTVGGFWLIAGP